MVAAILISIATSYKLPLSTTYVTFMVAMGTSLADKAWGSDSAVYRVAGVINVIGGWLLTALIAFTASGIIATILYYLGKSGLFILVVIVVFILTKNYFAHQNRRKLEIEEEKLDIVESKSIKGVIFESSKNISNFIQHCFKIHKKVKTRRKCLTRGSKSPKRILKAPKTSLEAFEPDLAGKRKAQFGSDVNMLPSAAICWS